MIYLDFETRSAIPVELGVYRYVEDEHFQIQLFSYAYDDEPIITLDLTNPLVCIPPKLKEDLLNPNVVKVAHNSQFERICFSRYCGMKSGEYIPPEGWICTATMGLYRGFPAKLEALGNALGIAEDAKKLKDGKRLIAKYAVPHYTKSGEMYFIDPEPDMFGYDPDWELYKTYNNQDVNAEREIYKTLVRRGGLYGVVKGDLWSDKLWEEYWVSEHINDNGVQLDKKFLKGAIVLLDKMTIMQNDRFRQVCDEYADFRGVSHIENTGSISQLKDLTGWANFTKAVLEDYIKTHKEPKTDEERMLKEICELRLSTGKSSVKKYYRMAECINEDGRARGLFRFGGAGQTLRYAGRLIQLQNLSKNHWGTTEIDGVLVSPELQIFKKRIVKQDETLLTADEDFADLLSQLVRPTLVPKKDHIFAVADFSAIEARVLSWLAGEQWRIDAFREGKDIYCETASRMFGVPVVKHGVNGELRAKGKVAELACGYGGGAGALSAFGADKMLGKEINRDEILKNLNLDTSKMSQDAIDFAIDEAIKEKVNSQLQEIVTNWRKSSPKVTQLWWDLESAFKRCLLTGATQHLNQYCGISVSCTTNEHGGDDVLINLPSGRSLFYNDAEIMHRDTDEVLNRRGSRAHPYEVNDMMKKIGRITFMRTVHNNLERTDTYSGKLTENVIQALARDILQAALANLADHGYCVVAHIHDEAISEVSIKKPDGTLKTNEELVAELKFISDLMAVGCTWSTGLPLRADGYLCNYYMKDSEGDIPEEAFELMNQDEDEEVDF